MLKHRTLTATTKEYIKQIETLQLRVDELEEENKLFIKLSTNAMARSNNTAIKLQARVKELENA